MVEDFSSRRRYFAYCTACASYCWLLQSVLKWLIKLALTAGAYDIRSPGEFTGFFFTLYKVRILLHSSNLNANVSNWIKTQ